MRISRKASLSPAPVTPLWIGAFCRQKRQQILENDITPQKRGTKVTPPPLFSFDQRVFPPLLPPISEILLNDFLPALIQGHAIPYSDHFSQCSSPRVSTFFLLLLPWSRHSSYPERFDPSIQHAAIQGDGNPTGLTHVVIGEKSGLLFSDPMTMGSHLRSTASRGSAPYSPSRKRAPWQSREPSGTDFAGLLVHHEDTSPRGQIGCQSFPKTGWTVP